MAECSGDPLESVQLYTWNSAMCSALWGPLAILEVVTRNAIHSALAAGAGQANWWASPDIHLLPGERDKITEAHKKLADEGKAQPTADDVVAATSMGLWAGLLTAGWARDPQYDYHYKLWLPHVAGAFPHRGQTGRRELWGWFNDLRKVRNRIAHHEPIWALSHSNIMTKIDDVLLAIDSDAADFVRDGQRVEMITKNRAKFFDSASAPLI